MNDLFRRCGPLRNEEVKISAEHLRNYNQGPCLNGKDIK